MELPIIAPAPVVTAHAAVFLDLFDNQCQFRHFQHYLTGLIVNQTHSFFLAFVAAALAAAGGGLSFLLIVGKLEPVKWRARSIL